MAVLLVVYGFYLLSVSPDAGYEEVTGRAKGGMLAVFTGNVLLIYFIAKR